VKLCGDEVKIVPNADFVYVACRVFDVSTTSLPVEVNKLRAVRAAAEGVLPRLVKEIDDILIAVAAANKPTIHIGDYVRVTDSSKVFNLSEKCWRTPFDFTGKCGKVVAKDGHDSVAVEFAEPLPLAGAMGHGAGLPMYHGSWVKEGGLEKVE
jgi:hypothetical protein